MSEDLFKQVVDAISKGDIAAVQGLLIKNPELVNKADDSDGRTPLHWAATYNQPEIAKTLLSHKAGIESDSIGWTPIHIASSIGNLALFDALVQNAAMADVAAKTDQGDSALDLAVSKKNTAIALKLLEQGVQARSKNKFGLTALHRAASAGSVPLTKDLVSKGKANVNATDNNGWTALHHALSEGHGDVAIALVELGADQEIKDSDGQVPIDVALDERLARWFKEKTA